MSDDRGADDEASSPDRRQGSGDGREREAPAPASAAARRERRGGATRPAGAGTSSTAAAGRRSAVSGDGRGATESALSRVVRFLREVAAELRKVIWPTRTQLVNYTGVVLVFLAVMVTFVALLDMGFGNLMFSVFGD